MRTRVGVLALTVVLSAACGKIKEVSSDGGPGSDAAPEVDAAPPDPCAAEDLTFDEAWTCVQTAMCEMWSRCLQPLPVEYCADFTLSPFGTNAAFSRLLIAEAIEAGRVSFHPEAVAGCVTFISDTSCAEFDDLGIELYEVCPIFSGTVEDTGQCITTAECATPGAFCNPTGLCELGDVCCARDCVAPSDIDGECTPFDDIRGCVAGAHCVQEGEIGICRSGEESAPCVDTSDCDSGLWCGDGACRPEVASGAPCVADDECPGPETCLSNPATKTSVCGRSDRVGDACDDACYGLICDRPDPGQLGTCIAIELGHDCSQDEYLCDSRYWCNPASNQCEPRSDVDQACGGDKPDCRLGLFCDNVITDTTNGTCKAPQPEGERCTQEFHCQSGICSGAPEVCQPYPGCYE